MIPITGLVVIALIVTIAGVNAFVGRRVIFDRRGDDVHSATDLPQKGNHHLFSA